MSFCFPLDKRIPLTFNARLFDIYSAHLGLREACTDPFHKIVGILFSLPTTHLLRHQDAAGPCVLMKRDMPIEGYIMSKVRSHTLVTDA